MSVYGKINANVLTSSGSFIKDDSANVAFYKTGEFTVSTKSALTLEVNGESVTIASNTAVTMPESANTGTDYVIWVTPTGTIQATTEFISPPVANSRKIGGFHYAPGGNATAQSGGNTTPQINEYSFWDLKFRPTCKDPRGMALVNNLFWCDIYLTGVDAITLGSSRYNQIIADGSSPPKIPVMFGGTGSSTYGSYTWFEAQELAMAFGKRSLTYWEFSNAAYGTTEAVTRSGSDDNYAPDKTGIGTSTNNPERTGSYYPDEYFTSKWGIIQSTGCMWIWGRERGGPYAAASWNANTEGRGSEYNAPNASLFGGAWYASSNSGSRCSRWALAASFSDPNIGSRFACDHLILD